MSEHDFDGDDDIFSKSGRFGGNAEKRKDPAKPGGFGKSGNAGKPKDSTASSAGEGDAEAMRHLEHEFAAIDRESHRTVAVVFAAIAAVVALIFFGLQIRDKTTLLIFHDNPPIGYLPVSEYSLRQPSTGKPISSARTWHYPSQYTILSDDATSSGVKPRAISRRCSDERQVIGSALRRERRNIGPVRWAACAGSLERTTPVSILFYGRVGPVLSLLRRRARLDRERGSSSWLRLPL